MPRPLCHAGVLLGLSTFGLVRGAAEPVVVDVDRYRVMEPMVESVRVVLSQRGETYSPAYIQGISRTAFQIGGICPCAPTCGEAMGPEKLLAALGYEFRRVDLSKGYLDLEAAAKDLVAAIRQEVRSGRAAVAWHAFTTAEFDVVCGFDDATSEFIGRGSYAGLDDYARAPQGRLATCGDICPPLGAVLVGERVREPDLSELEISALVEAVRHARSTRNVDKVGSEKWVFLEGLACYDRWVRDYRDDATKVPGVGDSYCLGILRSTRRSAADFLREVAPRHTKAQERLMAAASCFGAEADALDLLDPLIGWNAPREPDERRGAQAAELLQRARDSYAEGIACIEQALEAISRGARPTSPP